MQSTCCHQTTQQEFEKLNKQRNVILKNKMHEFENIKQPCLTFSTPPTTNEVTFDVFCMEMIVLQ